MSDLPTTVDSLDAIPEDVRKFYTTSSGENGKTKYSLNATEMYSALTAKDKALANERKVRTEFEGKYSKTSKELEGIDKDEYNRLKEKAKEWETEKEQKEREALEAKGKYEEALEKTKNTYSKEIADLKADYDKKLNALNESVENAQKSKRDYILTDKVRRSILKSGVFAEDVEDVLTLTRNRFSLNDKNEVVVKDEIGNKIDITLDNFFGESFKKAKPKFYQGTNSSGSGTPAGGSKGNAKMGEKELSSVDKIAQGLSKRK